MLRALLLPILVLTSTPADSAREPAVRLFLSNSGQYASGERALVEVQATDDGYLLVAQVDPDRRVRILFPIDPTDDNYVRGGRLYTILGRGDREGFLTDVGGEGVVFAAISSDPWRFDRHSLNGHWDLRTLNAEPIGDAESELVDLANRLSVDRFDYDILPYTVVGPASYAAQGADPDVVVEEVIAPAPSTTIILGGCVGCGTWGLYDPFYYDPWYWRAGIWGPVWTAPVWWNAWSPWWGPGWGWSAGWGWGGGWGGSWGSGPGRVAGWQYRPKAWDRQWAGRDVPYRDRWARSALAGNTVVGPLPGTGASQRVAFRDRLTDQPAITRTDAVAPGRAGGTRRGDGGFQRTRAGEGASEPGTRSRDRVPVSRRDGDEGQQQDRPEGRRREVGRERPGLSEAPSDSRRQGGSAPATRQPSVQQRDRSGLRESGEAGRTPGRGQRVEVEGRAPARRQVDRGGARSPAVQRSEPERREPTLERRGSRAQDAPRGGGESRSSGAVNRGGGSRNGGSAVRPPSGSGRSGGPTPSAPRSGGQSSSRRR